MLCGLHSTNAKVQWLLGWRGWDSAWEQGHKLSNSPRYKVFILLNFLFCLVVGAPWFLSVLGCSHRALWGGGSESCGQGRVQQGGFILWLMGKGSGRAWFLLTKYQKLTFNLWKTISHAKQVLQHYPLWLRNKAGSESSLNACTSSSQAIIEVCRDGTCLMGDEGTEQCAYVALIFSELLVWITAAMEHLLVAVIIHIH